MPMYRMFIGYATNSAIILMVWATLWGMSTEASSPPNGKIFALVILYAASITFGQVLELFKIPRLFGMLFAGFFLTNLTDLTFYPFMSATLRSVSLTVILLRGGLGLDLAVIRRMSAICLRMTFVPLVTEVICVAILGHYWLGLPFAWSFMVGFILAAACAAIIVPTMLSLQHQGLGTSKGIPTIVMAASSIDDVFAIAGFGVMLGFVFTSGEDSSTLWNVAKGPIEVFIGIFGGAIYGTFLWILPDQAVAGPDMSLARLALMVFGGLAFVFVSDVLGFQGSGPLGSLSLATVAGIKYRAKEYDISIEKSLGQLWHILEPFLFSLIGAEVDISHIDKSSILLVLAVILVTMVLRTVSTYASLYGSDMNGKEKAFVSIAWLSKAAVQAAVGPIALDIARQHGDKEDIKRATLVLTICFLTILVSTPVGTLGMAFTAKRWLQRDPAGPELDRA
ncbi:Sodium/hydrogen exchanger 9B2 [Halotydeus destructor]|nr:Sodium/hydrogen exchanger 9B2 [Halotydeus destructor]